MERALLPDRPANGGFPEPLEGEPVRVVVARHVACGVRTRVRLPDELPATVVRRLRCAGCHHVYTVEALEEVAVDPPVAKAAQAAEEKAPRARPRRPRPSARLRVPRPSFNPQSRSWRIASALIAAIAVVAALLAIQGGDGEAPVTSAPAGASAESAASAATAAAAADPGAGSDQGAGAQLVRTDTFTVALPQGWERAKPQGGATFAAVAEDGAGDATLWIERDPDLDFAQFEARSVKQLRSLAGSASVAERVAAPTPEGTIVRLAADAPPGEPRYEATLRAAGPYRFYLATTLQPDAPRVAIDGVELIHGSFTPEANAG